MYPQDISTIFDYNSAIHKYKTRSATNQGLFVPEIKKTHLFIIKCKYVAPLLILLLFDHFSLNNSAPF